MALQDFFIKTALAAAALTLSACGVKAEENAADSIKTTPPQAAPDVYADYPLSVRDQFQACGVNEDEFYRLMGLSYKAFDQDFKGGWREVDYKETCQEAAAHLIKSYITLHDYHYKSQRGTLMWHTGQVLAGAGKYDDAIVYFSQTYKSEANQAPWNLYVDGTIAFLQKDKTRLIALRDELAAMPVSEDLKAARRKFLKDNPEINMPDGFIDDPQNLSVMNDLIACFDQPYSKAYGKCNR